MTDVEGALTGLRRLRANSQFLAFKTSCAVSLKGRPSSYNPMRHDQELIPADALLGHAGFVRSLARNLAGDLDQADDIEQQAWLVALDSPPAKRDGIRAWFRMVVRNLVLGARRRSDRCRERESRAASPVAFPSAEELMERRAVLVCVVNAVLALEEPYLSTILLRFYENRPPREIARNLGIPVTTVRSRLHRALKKLRANLEPRLRRDGKPWALALAGLVPPVQRSEPILSCTSLHALPGVLLMGLKKVSVAAALLVVCGVTWWAVENRATPEDGAHGRSEPPRESGFAKRDANSTPNPVPTTPYQEPGPPRWILTFQDHQTKELIEGVAVLSSTVVIGRSSPKGTAALPGKEPQSLVCAHAQYRACFLDLDQVDHDTHRVVTLERGLAIEGIVHDERGEAIDGADVYVSRGAVAWEEESRIVVAGFVANSASADLGAVSYRRLATTDSSGRFVCAGLLPGRHLIECRKPGYVIDARVPQIATEAGQPVVITLARVFAAIMAGREEDGSGIPGGLGIRIPTSQFMEPLPPYFAGQYYAIRRVVCKKVEMAKARVFLRRARKGTQVPDVVPLSIEYRQPGQAERTAELRFVAVDELLPEDVLRLEAVDLPPQDSGTIVVAARVKPALLSHRGSIGSVAWQPTESRNDEYVFNVPPGEYLVMPAGGPLVEARGRGKQVVPISAGRTKRVRLDDVSIGIFTIKALDAHRRPTNNYVLGIVMKGAQMSMYGRDRGPEFRLQARIGKRYRFVLRDETGKNMSEWQEAVLTSESPERIISLIESAGGR